MTNSFQATKTFAIVGGITGTLEISVEWPQSTFWADPEALAELLWLDAQRGLLESQRRALGALAPNESEESEPKAGE